MNLKKTLILAVLLLLAFLYLRQVTIPSHQREAQKSQVFPKLTVADFDSIQSQRRADPQKPVEEFTLRVRGTVAPTPTPARAGAEDAEDERDAAVDRGAEEPQVVWELVQPVAGVVDSQVADALAGALRGLELSAPLDEHKLERDFAVYGLDKPALTLVVRTKGGEEVEIAFGARNEFLSKRFVKVSGRSSVFLVDDGVFGLLDKRLDDVRSKTPVQFADSDLRFVTVRAGGGTTKLRQVSSGEWKILEPTELPAAPLAVQELLRAVRELRVVEFIDTVAGGKEAYGLQQPAVELMLEFTETHTPRTLRVALGEVVAAAGEGASAAEGQAEKRIYFESSGAPTVYKTGVSSLESFARDSDDLRERHIFRLQGGTLGAEDIERVQGTGTGMPEVVIATNQTDWTVNGKRSDPVFVEQYLNDMVNLEATAFPTEVPADAFSEPLVTLVITRKGKPTEPLTLTVGRALTTAEAVQGGGAHWARLSENGAEPGRQVIVLIRDIEAKRIVPHEEALIEVPPTPAAATPVVAMVTAAATPDTPSTPEAGAALVPPAAEQPGAVATEVPTGGAG